MISKILIDNTPYLVLLVIFFLVVVFFHKSISSYIDRITILRIKHNQVVIGSPEIQKNTLVQRQGNTIIRRSEELDKSPCDGDILIQFETKDARCFYDTCAKNYDRANSDWLWETHDQVALEILENIPKKNAQILDLGGGTGRYIATSVMKHNQNSISKWVNYDFSNKMQGIFRAHMKIGKMLYETIEMDIHHLSKWRSRGKFDIIIMSFVLSSMQNIPDFSEIRKKIKKGGTLIVSEGDPIYTMEKGKKWSVKGDGNVWGFSLNPINPVQILVRASEAGFELIDQKLIKKSISDTDDPVDYSYILSFVAL